MIIHIHVPFASTIFILHGKQLGTMNSPLSTFFSFSLLYAARVNINIETSTKRYVMHKSIDVPPPGYPGMSVTYCTLGWDLCDFLCPGVPGLYQICTGICTVNCNTRN